jgi:hypothetical protein
MTITAWIMVAKEEEEPGDGDETGEIATALQEKVRSGEG